MKDVKKFVEKFVEVEAKTANLKRIPDLDTYNKAAKELALFSEIVYMTNFPETELESESFYNEKKWLPKAIPRFIFKISRYKHDNYGDVWAAFTSEDEPEADYKFLKNVFLIYKKDGDFQLGAHLLFSRYDSDGLYYEWRNMSGYEDLGFDTLEGPFEIERYMEPLESFEGLKVYNDNI